MPVLYNTVYSKNKLNAIVSAKSDDERIYELDAEYNETTGLYEVEIELIDKDNLIEYIKEHPDKVVIMNGEQLKDVFNL